MAFVRVSKAEKSKMFREGGNRERSIMNNASCVTNAPGMKGCVKFHDKKNGRTAIYRKGRGWIS